jgi:hypothetical protein
MKAARKHKDPTTSTRTAQFVNGKTTGLGIYQYFSQVFESNERCNANNKLTNTAIETMVRREFAHVDTFIASLDEKKQTVNSFRHLYNAGKILKNMPKPEKLSLRYDNDGHPAHGRTGRKLTAREILALCVKYEIDDPRASRSTFRVDAKTLITNKV